MTAVYRAVEGPAVTRFRDSIPRFRFMPDETADVEHVAAVFYLPALQALAQDEAMGGTT